jgi:uncharacterized protein (DUF2235 family)
MRIACFCDGTWNDPGTDTNVYKMSNSTLQIAGQQAVIYDSGVGTDGTPIDKLFGGAFGTGLFNKIKTCYTQIAHVYSPGDELFLFGFSRGAYTARCLAGMIAICGLPTQNVDQNCIDQAFNAYRDTNPVTRKATLDGLANYSMFDAQITMVGVWDTVGALGIPSCWGGIDDLQFGFLSVGLHCDVKNAFHAMAIDEQRKQFPATLWQPPYAADQTVEQVWFAGVHCDVGGGYEPDPADNNTRLADVTLGWMLGKAVALGLQVDATFAARYIDANNNTVLGGRYATNAIHNSHSGVFWLTPPVHRAIASGSTISNSVAIRCASSPGYAPVNLTLTAGVPDPAYPTQPAVLNSTPITW